MRYFNLIGAAAGFAGGYLATDMETMLIGYGLCIGNLIVFYIQAHLREKGIL